MQNNDENAFPVALEEEVDYIFQKPDVNLYKDVNSDTTFDVQKDFSTAYMMQFGRSRNKKAENMYKEEYLLSLRKAFSSGQIYLVGRVASEYRKSVVYSVDIKFSRNGLIDEVECECAVGKGPRAFCKHVCVVLQGVQDCVVNGQLNLRKTCTSQLQTFHKASKEYTGSPIKAKDLKISKKRTDGKGVDWDPRPMCHIQNPEYPRQFRNRCISFAAEGGNEMPILHLFQHANLKAFYNDHDYGHDHPEIHFLKLLQVADITQEEISAIEKSTRDQSLNKEWMLQRSVRINSSMFGKVIKSTDKAKIAKELLLVKDLSGVPAIEHGKRFEPEAKARFMKETGLQVHPCGTFVCKDHPFLASSPDGIINEDVCVEFKCPFSAKNKVITPETVLYLYKCSESGKLKLKKSHDYFYQIQGQMLCSNKKKVFFVVFTLKDMLCMEIDRDDSFIDEMIDELNIFFLQHFRQALLDTYMYKSTR